MALPSPTSVPPFSVYYDQGDIHYSDGTNWNVIVTAGSFTKVTANGQTTPLNLGTWAGLIVDDQVQTDVLQTAVNNLTLQVANLQATVNTLNSQLATAQANIIQTIIGFIRSGYLK